MIGDSLRCVIRSRTKVQDYDATVLAHSRDHDGAPVVHAVVVVVSRVTAIFELQELT